MDSAGLVARRRRDTRLAIAQAAARLFAERGVAATGAEEIAQAAGVSLRTFYRHAHLKQDAVIPLLEVGAERWQEQLGAIAPGADLRSAIADVVAHALDVGDDGPGQALTRGLVLTMLQDDDLRRVWGKVNGDSCRALESILAVHLDGSDPLAAPLLAEAATASIRITLERWAAAGAPSGAPLGEAARETFQRLSHWCSDAAAR